MLSLNSNLISGLGAIHLAEGIQHCQNLETLELGYNFIWFSDIQSIAFTLKESTKLERVFVPIDLIDMSSYVCDVNEELLIS